MNRMSFALQKKRHDLALALMDVGAFLTSTSDHPLVVERQGPTGTERGFKLKLHEKNPDAPLSPFFLNLRTPDNPKPGPLSPGIVELAAWCMQAIQIERDLTFDAVVGVPRAGEPFATILGQLTGKPCITLDKWEHDGKRSIASPKGNIPLFVRKILVVDDLITQADSKIETVKVLEDASMWISDVVVLVDREQGGREELDGWGCDLYSLFTITELLNLYVDAGRMAPQLRTDIQTYLTVV